jgi:hypothetical protein
MWASVAGDVRLTLGRDPLENTARLVEWYRHNYLVALVARDLRQAVALNRKQAAAAVRSEILMRNDQLFGAVWCAPGVHG